MNDPATQFRDLGTVDHQRLCDPGRRMHQLFSQFRALGRDVTFSPVAARPTHSASPGRRTRESALELGPPRMRGRVKLVRPLGESGVVSGSNYIDGSCAITSDLSRRRVSAVKQEPIRSPSQLAGAEGESPYL